MSEAHLGPSFWRWLNPFGLVVLVMAVVVLVFYLGMLAAPTPVHERTVVNYVTETRQTAEQTALSQCEAQNTGGGAPQYGVCVQDVERAFHGH